MAFAQSDTVLEKKLVPQSETITKLVDRALTLQSRRRSILEMILGHVPGIFAYPAGLGDILVGLVVLGVIS